MTKKVDVQKLRAKLELERRGRKQKNLEIPIALDERLVSLAERLAVPQSQLVREGIEAVLEAYGAK